MINIRNARTSTKVRAKPFILGKNNPMHHYMLGAAQLESILAKKTKTKTNTEKVNGVLCSVRPGIASSLREVFPSAQHW